MLKQYRLGSRFVDALDLKVLLISLKPLVIPDKKASLWDQGSLFPCLLTCDLFVFSYEGPHYNRANG